MKNRVVKLKLVITHGGHALLESQAPSALVIRIALGMLITKGLTNPFYVTQRPQYTPHMPSKFPVLVSNLPGVSLGADFIGGETVEQVIAPIEHTHVRAKEQPVWAAHKLVQVL